MEVWRTYNKNKPYGFQFQRENSSADLANNKEEPAEHPDLSIGIYDSLQKQAPHFLRGGAPPAKELMRRLLLEAILTQRRIVRIVAESRWGTSGKTKCEEEMELDRSYYAKDKPA